MAVHYLKLNRVLLNIIFYQAHRLDGILQNIELATKNKEQTIYLYCRSGKRSGKAEKALQGIGYINAKNIGGMREASSTLQLKITNK